MGAMTVYLASPEALGEARIKYNRRMAVNRVAMASGN